MSGLSVNLRQAAPIGEVAIFPRLAVPRAFVILDGREVSRTQWARLFAYLGPDAGPGDGATTFTVPDWRDDFPRMIGDNRAAGSRQADAVRDHRHDVDPPGTRTDDGNLRILRFNDDDFGGNTGLVTSNESGSLHYNPHDHYVDIAKFPSQWVRGDDVGVNVSTESRPRNVAVVMAIRGR